MGCTPGTIALLSACQADGHALPAAFPATPPQASVSLPPVDAPADAVRACYSAAAYWAGAFWDGVFDLLPSARAAKSDSAQDTRGVVEGLLTGERAMRGSEWGIGPGSAG